MGDEKLAAERSGEPGGRLLALATGLLGSAGTADAAVQEASTRWGRGHADDVDDPAGRLTALVARVCLETLTRRSARLDDPLSDVLTDPMRALAPAERVAFVLHDHFAMPMGEVAAILGRTSTATGQLAGRARRRVQSPDRTLDADRTVQSRVVGAFLTASGTGDLEELTWLLHPQAQLHADTGAVAAGAPTEARGAQEVAETFAGMAGGARPVLLDGFPAAARAVDGRAERVFGFTVVDGRIAEIELLADREVLLMLDLRPET